MPKNTDYFYGHVRENGSSKGPFTPFLYEPHERGDGRRVEI